MNGLAPSLQMVYKYFVSGQASPFHFFLLHPPLRVFTISTHRLTSFVYFPFRKYTLPHTSSIHLLQHYDIHLSRHTSVTTYIFHQASQSSATTATTAHLPICQDHTSLPFPAFKRKQNHFSTFHQNTQLCSEEPDSGGCL